MADEQKEGASKRTWSHRLGVLAVMALGLAGGVLMHAKPFRIQSLPLPVRLALILAAAVLTIPIHEAGHVVAGALVGFRCFVVSVWPLTIYRGSAGWRIGISRYRTPGYAGCYPAGGRSLRSRMVIYGAGGSLALLLSGATAAVWVAHSEGLLPGWFRFGLWVFFLISTLTGIGGLLPISGKNVPSDGVRIGMLLRGGPAVERSCGLLLLVGASLRGVRPKDLDPELIRLAASVPDGSLDDLTAACLHYNWAVDSGRVEDAGALLSEILERRPQLLAETRLEWLCEAAWFEAAFRQDAAAARKWMEHPENRVSRASAGARLKAQAAIAALEGRFEEAEKLARQVLRELDRSPDLGVAKSIRETLIRVTARPPDRKARA